MSTAAPSSAPSDAYRQSGGEVAAALGTDARYGLSEDAARARLQELGPNELATEKPAPAWRRFLAQFQDVLVVLLLVATADLGRPVGVRARHGAAVRGDRDFRRGAAQRDDGLRAGVARRGGGRGAASDVGGRGRRRFAMGSGGRVPAAELVPGDLMLIEEGDTIPADARVDRVRRTADERGGADRRESSGGQGHRGRSPRTSRSATGPTCSSAARRRPTGAALPS